MPPHIARLNRRVPEDDYMQRVALAAAAIRTGSRSPALGHRSQPRPAYAWRHAPRTQPTLPRLAPNRYAPRTSRRLLCRPNGSINSTAAHRARSSTIQRAHLTQTTRCDSRDCARPGCWLRLCRPVGWCLREPGGPRPARIGAHRRRWHREGLSRRRGRIRSGWRSPRGL